MSVGSALKQIVQSAYGWAKTAVAGRGAVRSDAVDSPAAAVTPTPEPVETATRKARPNLPAKRRTGMRSDVLKAARAAGADGATRAELLEALSVKGDPSGEKAVSNALSALKKSGALLHKGNKYIAA